MKIEARRIKSRTEFVCICDYCDKPITDSGMAMIAWSDPQDFLDDVDREVKTFHKLPCLEDWTEIEEAGKRHVMTQELDYALIYIGNGMSINWKSAHDWAEKGL